MPLRTLPVSARPAAPPSASSAPPVAAMLPRSAATRRHSVGTRSVRPSRVSPPSRVIAPLSRADASHTPRPVHAVPRRLNQSQTFTDTALSHPTLTTTLSRPIAGLARLTAPLSHLLPPSRTPRRHHSRPPAPCAASPAHYRPRVPSRTPFALSCAGITSLVAPLCAVALPFVPSQTVKPSSLSPSSTARAVEPRALPLVLTATLAHHIAALARLHKLHCTLQLLSALSCPAATLTRP
ncbi:hypothetical protein DENSPDRAFT_885012 [Dentipellis sp. KUC8613]|nr:hypothetical protein DENSPDRAFT_885012 [Dentipellis sp. KUC8613]